jgi:hypothetical protein
MTRAIQFGLALLLTAALGCGDDDRNKKGPLPNSTTGNNVAMNNGGTNNVTTNNGGTNNATTNNGGTNNATTNNGGTNTRPGPCARLDRGVLRFPATAVGSSSTRILTLTNCSTTDPITIESYATEDPVFTTRLVGSEVVQPGDAAEIEVTFTPTAVGNYESVLGLVHSAVDGPGVIQLIGEATDSACVTSIAEARNQSTGGSFDAAITVSPGQVVEFDGSSSTGGSGPLVYSWSIITKPSGSNTTLSNDTAAAPVMVPDIPGNYRVQLVATDTMGTESCNVAEVAITATSSNPGNGTSIAVQLVWETPADATGTGGGDLDLHWKHEQGTWNTPPWDCYWNNKQPDWGRIGDDTDDPSMDLDATTGGGPENINQGEVEPGVTYSVGVYYFSDATLGPSYATVRVFENDVLIGELTDVFLANQQDFLHAFDYNTATGLTTVNQVTAGFP